MVEFANTFNMGKRFPPRKSGRRRRADKDVSAASYIQSAKIAMSIERNGDKLEKAHLMNRLVSAGYKLPPFPEHICREFGLSSLFDKPMPIGPEIKRDWKISDAEFSSMVAGEPLVCSRVPFCGQRLTNATLSKLSRWEKD